MTRTFLLPLAALAALTFAPSAHAQSLTLNSGDNVTVSGAGTVGTIGGTPTANGMTSYSSVVNYGAVTTYGTATFTLGPGGSLTSSGLYSGGIFTNGTGTISVTGGSINTSNSGSGIFTVGNGTINVSGGTFTGTGRSYGIYTVSSAVVNITGGTFNFPQGTGLSPYSAIFNLYSLGDTPFLINGVPMNNTTLTHGSSGTISGTLLNGDPLSTTFYNGGTINLNVGPVPAPEPSAWAALAIGALGLGALTVRARRRTA